MPTKWRQERASGSKNGHGIPPLRAFCGKRVWSEIKKLQSNAKSEKTRVYVFGDNLDFRNMQTTIFSLALLDV